MTRFGVNGQYFMHSTPEYNATHRKQNSEYNAKYYQAHKEKWKDNDSSDGSSSKSSNDDEDENEDDKKKKKSSKESKKITFNGGSKAISKDKKKSSSTKSSKKETEEEKKKREEEEKKEAEVKAEEERKNNKEVSDNLKTMLEVNSKAMEEYNKTKKKKTTIKHSMNYINVNTNSYIKHHGIDGQKWGVHHGPPYPLDRKVSVRIEKRAKSNNNHNGGNFRKDMRNAASRGLKEGRKNAINNVAQEIVRPLADVAKGKKKKVSYDPKRIARNSLVILGSAAATAVLAALGDKAVDVLIAGGKYAVGNLMLRAPFEGIANVGVNMLLKR